MAELIVVNARYLRRPATGVEVHAHEVVDRLTGLRLVAPSQKRARGAPATLWEQTSLALAGRRALLWSPCNTGPLAVRRHVVTLHDAVVHDHPEWYSRAYARRVRTLDSAVARRALRVATPSQWSAERIIASVGVSPDRVRVVGSGVRRAFELTSPERDTDVQPTLVTVGATGGRKGVERLVRCMARAEVALRLVVVGHVTPGVLGPLAPDALAGDGVELVGRIDDEELVSLVRSAAGFVSLSPYEGFGLPPVEAAACGVPVVVSDIPAHRQSLGGVPGVVHVGTDDEVVDALRQIASGSIPSPDGRAVRARHSWEAVADRYVELFAELGEVVERRTPS